MEVDYTQLLVPLAEKTTDILFRFTQDALSNKSSVKRTLEDYLKTSLKNYGYTKTILYRDKPTLVSNFYISTKLKTKDKIIHSDDISEIFQVSRSILITGLAGSGKSIFCRNIFLEILCSSKWGVPIFVELRNLPNEEPYIENAIVELFKTSNNNFQVNDVVNILNCGPAKIILDGFDEIDPAKVESVGQEIVFLTKKYQGLTVFLTSRPDETVSSMEGFTELRVCPLDKDSAIKLVSKLQYDEIVKSKFLDELKGDLFENHQSFLSNPLLLTIMLMTYEQLADIPGKMHIFYEQAFDFLFNKHDATKSMYKRTHFSNLSIDDFKKVLSAFSILTYINREFRFSDSKALEHLESTKKIISIEFDKQKYLSDLEKSTCILMRDGLQLSFSHRSFQEYFSALYISKLTSENRPKLLSKLCEHSSFDNVVDLLFEMNVELVEKDLILPKVKHFNKRMLKIIKDDGWFVSVLKLFMDEIEIGSDSIDEDGRREGKIAFVMRLDNTSAMNFSMIRKLYRNHFSDIWSVCDSEIDKYFENNMQSRRCVLSKRISKSDLDFLHEIGIQRIAEMIEVKLIKLENDLKMKRKNVSNDITNMLIRNK
jgi:hypothetical protein